MNKRTRPACWFLLVCGAAGLAAAEQPVGLVLGGAGAIERPGRETPIDAAAGVELYGGDKLRANREGVAFAFCPGRSIQTLAPGREFEVDTVRLPAGSSLFSDAGPAPACELPELTRMGVASASPLRIAAPAGTFESRLQAIPEPERSRFRQRWDALPNAGGALELLIEAARAVMLDDAGLTADAVAAWTRIGERWPAAVWTREAALRASRRTPQTRGWILPPRPEAAPGPKGRTYALLVGISRYRPDSGVPWLNYADKDAESFAEYLQMERGGGLRLCPDAGAAGCEIRLLVNERATLARLASEFETFVGDERHARPENTLIVFIAAHGADPAMEQEWSANTRIRKEPVILTYDSDYNEAKVSGYLMSDIRELMARFARRYGRVLVFADLCRAGNIGPIAGSGELQPAVVEVFRQGKGNLGLFMASQATEDAYESVRFGGGHGAFTYFALEGLNTVSSDRQQLIFDDLLDHIKRGVRRVTLDRQVPDGRAVNVRMPVAENLALAPMPLAPAEPLDRAALRRPRGVRLSAPKLAAPGAARDDAPNDFERALARGRLRRDEPASAFAALDRFRADPSADAASIADWSERLRVALEDRGQKVILLYLRGEQLPPAKPDYEEGEKDFRAALELAPGAAWDESRMLFCRGRALIFDRRYDEAITALKAATRLDPARAYAYNALGIAYLEQASRDAGYIAVAERAFHDAIRFAPYWPYPWHNLALASTERGDFEAAIAAYRRAIEIAPDYPYLPYNLGLLYQRLNRAEDARRFYDAALKTAARGRDTGVLFHSDGSRPEGAMAYNALGVLAASRRKLADAERLYRLALRDDPRNRSARHNLAQLLSARDRISAEAESLWRQNLAEDPHHVTSRLAYARFLSAAGRWRDAVDQYRIALPDVPAHIPTHREFASALRAIHEDAAAVEILRNGLRLSPSDPALWEELGDAEAALGLTREAFEDYSKAEQAGGAQMGDAARKRLKSKKTALRDGGTSAR